MRAVLKDSGGVRFETAYSEPTVGKGEVLVRVLRAGICETDLQLIRGYMDFEGVLGHEFVGVAEEGRYKGCRVAGEINCSCGTCDFCNQGLGNHCPQRTVLGILGRDGAFAEYLVLPEANLHVIPDGVETDEAVFVEPLAAAYQIPAQLPHLQGQRAAVLGDGRLGNLCAQVLMQQKCRVTVVGKHADKLSLLDGIGIQTELLADITPLRSFDLVVDCTGSESGLSTAVQLVKPRGTIVLKTTVAGHHQLSLAPLVIDEITLVGSRCGPFDRAIEALASRQIDVRPLISDRYPLEQAPQALAHAGSGSGIKILLDIADE